MATSLACGLDRARFAPFVVSLYDPFEGGFEPELERCGVPVFHLGKRPGFDLRMYGRLRRAMQGIKPHIVHTHSYVMRYTLPVAPGVMVHTVHNLADREVDAIGRFVHRLGYRRGAIPVAVGTEVARSFRAMYGFDPEVIPNGIDTSRFAAPRRPSRDGPVRIISVARLDPQKNPKLLASALPPGCELILVGQGSLRSELERLPGVTLAGVRTDVAELLAEADVFAMASDWEGRPIALMEAMAAGLPVVATAVGGIPEVLGDAGILVPPGDVAAMRAALTALAGDPQRRSELGARAQARARVFDLRLMVAAYSRVFERAIAR